MEVAQCQSRSVVHSGCAVLWCLAGRPGSRERSSRIPGTGGCPGRIAPLTDYLERERASQPLHNRLALVWASSKLPAALPAPLRKAILDEILRAQQPDGGWAIASLGPWRPHPEAPPSEGSNSYATAYAAFILQQAGMSRSDKAVARALDWLRAHQDRESGSWAADSLNSRHEPDSMQFRFMQDAATAFASLALLGK